MLELCKRELGKSLASSHLNRFHESLENENKSETELISSK